MSEFDGKTLPEISEMVNQDNATQMKGQVEGWQGMAYLFDSQLARLESAAQALGSAWTSSAGAVFLEQVGLIQTTLEAARDNAIRNARAWNNITSQVEATKSVIWQIEADYAEELAAKQTAYDKAMAEAHDSFFDSIGLGDDEPDKVKEDEVRAKYDQQARDVMDYAAEVYQTEYMSNLWEPPTYQGPTGAVVVQPGEESGSASVAGGTALTGAASLGLAAPSTWIPTTSFTGPTLAGASAPTLPTPTIPTTPVTPGVAPPTATPGGLPGVVPSTFVPKTPGVPRLPTIRTPLLPTAVEPGPSVIGSRPGTGRVPSGGGNQSVIGGNRGLAPGTGKTGVPGGTGKPGVRGAQGRTVAAPKAVESVVGQGKTAATRGGAAGRPTGVRRGAIADADGVVRPSRRGETAAGRGGAGGRGDKTSGRGGIGGRTGQRRSDERDSANSEIEGTELWEVADGVPAVVEPPTPYNARAERPGPHVGRPDMRR